MKELLEYLESNFKINSTSEMDIPMLRESFQFSTIFEQFDKYGLCNSVMDIFQRSRCSNKDMARRILYELGCVLGLFPESSPRYKNGSKIVDIAYGFRDEAHAIFRVSPILETDVINELSTNKELFEKYGEPLLELGPSCKDKYNTIIHLAAACRDPFDAFEFVRNYIGPNAYVRLKVNSNRKEHMLNKHRYTIK